MKEEIRKIGLNTGAQLVGKAFSAATTLITVFLIARKYGPEESGAFFLMTGFATYFYLLTDFGINAIVSRELSADANNKEKLRRHFNNLLTFRFLEAVVIFLILILVLPSIPFKLTNLTTLRWGIVIGLTTIFSQAVYNSCTAIFQSRLDYQKAAWASVAGNFFFLVLVLWLLRGNFPILYLVGANTLGAGVVALTAFYFVQRAVGPFFWQLDWALLKALVKSSLPLGLGIVLTVIVAKADQFLLSVLPLNKNLAMTNGWALGNYGLAYKFFENILVFPTYFVNSAYPLLVLNYVHDREKFKKIIWFGLGFLVPFSVLIAASGWVLAPLIEKISNGGFYLAPLALRILLLSLPLFFTSAFLLFVLIAQGQQKKVPYIYLTAAVFNLVLNLIFIPSHGFLGSAVITGLTELLILVLVGYFSFRSLRLAAS